MFDDLCNYLAIHLKSEVQPICLAGGWAKTVRRDKEVTYPASNLCMTECDTSMVALTPSADKPCIIFFKDPTKNFKENVNKRLERYQVDVNLHVFINETLLSCTQSDLISEIYSCIPRKFCCNSIKKAFIKGKSIKNTDAYAGYKFAKQQDYQRHPYYNYIVSIRYDVLYGCPKKTKTKEVC